MSNAPFFRYQTKKRLYITPDQFFDEIRNFRVSHFSSLAAWKCKISVSKFVEELVSFFTAFIVKRKTKEKLRIITLINLVDGIRNSCVLHFPFLAVWNILGQVYQRTRKTITRWNTKTATLSFVFEWLLNMQLAKDLCFNERPGRAALLSGNLRYL